MGNDATRIINIIPSNARELCPELNRDIWDPIEGKVMPGYLCQF